jgi:hypothetical protein
LTNTDWARAAINALIGHGYDPGVATQAISSYLAGGTLSSQLQAALSDAIRYAGAPPSPIAASAGVAPPAPSSGLIAGVGASHAGAGGVLADWATRGLIPAGTIPIYSQSTGGGLEQYIVGAMPFGTAINPTGPPVETSPGILAYPVSGGFVTADDLAAAQNASQAVA